MIKRKTKAILAVVLATAALMAPLKIRAQAFDGDMDEKIHAGYIHFEGTPCAEIGYWEGANDYLSYGFFIRMAFGKETEKKAMRWADVGSTIYFHWDELLKLPSRLDLFTGFQLSYQSGWLAGGLRYNFCERWGLYAQVQQGLFDVVRSSDIPGTFNDKKFGVSFGLTFSLQ